MSRARWLALLAVACEAPPAPPGPVFVRGGVVSWAAVDGARPLPGGRWLVEREWAAGDAVRVGASDLVAPARAECLPVFHVDLGDVARRVAVEGGAPDGAIAFSPDGSSLAVGTWQGEVIVADGWTGEVRARRRLAESLVKQVAWSPDGAVVYAAEQSPDARVVALAAEDLSERWSLRLADRVGTSAPPPAEDLYGVYTLPAAYGLHVLDDGALVVSAVHAWNPSDTVRENLSQLLVVGPDGAVRAAWPPEPASVTLMHPRVGGGRVAVPVGRSATGDAPEGLPVGGVQVLSLPDLAPVTATSYPPLEPWYHDVFVWEAVDVSADALVVGLADGRVFRHGAGGVVRRDLGVPLVAGGVPVGATIGHAALVGDETVVLTSDSAIPWGAADPALRPPAAHPEENAVSVLGPGLETRWTWRGLAVPTGLSVAGTTLVVGAGARTRDERLDQFGALVFRLDGEGSGEERLEAFCATEAPVFFRHAVTADGRVAVVEIPWVDASGVVHGTYRATVLR